MERYCVVLFFLALLVSGPAIAQRQIQIAPPYTTLKTFESPDLVALSQSQSEEYPAQYELQQQLEQGRYQQAQKTAIQILNDVEKTDGVTAEQHISALVNLATVNYFSQDYVASENSYRKALAIITTSNNVRDNRLIRPLYGLGLAQYAAGHYSDAALSLERAIFVTRTNLGLKSVEQLTMVGALIECHLALGDHAEVARLQRKAVVIAERGYGPTSAEFSHELQQAGELYRRIGNYAEEIKIHRQRFALIKAAEGEQSLALIPVLLALAKASTNDLRQGFDVYQPLLDAEDIAQANSNTPIPLQAEVWVALGDFSLLYGRRLSARNYYLKTYKILTDSGDTQLRKKLLETTPKLFLPDPPPPGKRDKLATPVAWPSGEMVLNFDIDERGRPNGIQIQQFSPDNSLIEQQWKPQILQAFRYAFFRPLVTSTGLKRQANTRYVYQFRYQPAEEGAD